MSALGESPEASPAPLPVATPPPGPRPVPELPESRERRADAEAALLGELAPCGLVVTDGDSRIILVNPRFAQLSGRATADVPGASLGQRLTGASRLFWESRLLPKLLEERFVNGMALSVRGAEGRPDRTFFVSAIAEDAPELAGGVRLRFAFLEADQRHEYERSLLESRRVAEDQAQRVRILQAAAAGAAQAHSEAELGESLVSAAIEASDTPRVSLGLVTPDGGLRTIAGERPLRALTGPDLDALFRGERVSLCDPGEIAAQYPEDAGDYAAAQVEAATALPLLADGRVLGVLTCWFPRPCQGDDDRFGILRSLADGAVPALQRLSLLRSLEHRASHDPLTGLPNRRRAEETLDALLGDRRGSGDGLGVVFVDLDGFKAINDREGHGAGDQVLRLAADRLTRSLRAGDTVARLGGDEFLLICPGVGPGDLAAITERARAALAELGRMPVACGLSASIGAVHHDGGADAGAALGAELVAAADAAMYRSKRQGKNRVTVTAWSERD